MVFLKMTLPTLANQLVVCLILMDRNKINASYSVAVLEEFDMFWRN